MHTYIRFLSDFDTILKTVISYDHPLAWNLDSRVTQALGTGGTGSLMFGGSIAKMFERAIGTLNVTRAEDLIIAAMQPTKEGRELFAALMTRGTASAQELRRAETTLRSWAAQTGSTDDGDE